MPLLLTDKEPRRESYVGAEDMTSATLSGRFNPGERNLLHVLHRRSGESQCRSRPRQDSVVKGCASRESTLDFQVAYPAGLPLY